MSIIRIAKLDEIRPSHVALVFLVCATLAGTCLLTNGPKVEAPPDGGKPWSPNSWLRSVVGVLDLNYSQTTAHGVEIKSLVFGLGAALAVALVSLAVAIPPRAGDEANADDIVIPDPDSTISAESPRAAPFMAQLPPLLAAQVLMGVYLLWSFAGTIWSSSPELALGGSLLLLTQLAWCYALGNGLNRLTAKACAYGLIGVLTLTAIMAVWFHYERNPLVRAGYPSGNPTVLAAILLPALLLSITLFPSSGPRAVQKRSRENVMMLVFSVASLALVGWAFYLADSRGAQVGLAAGIAVFLFLVLPRGARSIGALVAGLAALGLGWSYYSQAASVSSTGRDATVRTRLYAWNYALDLVGQKPLLGHGQGGYTRLADNLAARDADRDPIALNAPLGHAHNEWLETLTDLGSIGAVLLLTALAMTFIAGLSTLSRQPDAESRWILCGLLASAAAIIVSEALGVGLRLPGLPVIFYTLIGLIWAMCGCGTGFQVAAATVPPVSNSLASRCGDRWPEAAGVLTSLSWTARLSRNDTGRVLAAVIGGALALLIALVNVLDFHGARDAFEVQDAIRKHDWNRAMILADSARHRLLDPFRRLAAMELLCGVHLHIARYHLDSYQQRMSQIKPDEEPNSTISSLARDDLQVADSQQRAGLNVLKTLVDQSPGYWGSGELLAELRLVRAQLHDIEGHPEAAQQEALAAATALQQELLRRPFDTELTLRLVRIAGPHIKPAEVIDLVARPLRSSALYADYNQLLLQIINVPELSQAIDEPCQEIMSVGTDSKETEWKFRWAPEILRLGAILQLPRGDYEKAESFLIAALALYDHLTIPAVLAAGQTRADLADYQFFAGPDQPERAIATARAALAAMPQSEPGRALARVLSQRLYIYVLAAGREDEARSALRTENPGASEAQIDSQVGLMYMALCESFRQKKQVKPPTAYSQWVNRALELNPTSNVLWLWMADSAFEAGDDEASARYLRRALELGADPNLVTAFVQLGLSKRPDSAAFKVLHEELLQKFQKNPTSAPSGPSAPQSQPSEPP